MQLTLTSAVGQGEVPSSRARGRGQARKYRVTFQNETLAAAVADFIPDVKSGALLEAILQLPGVATSVARKSCKRKTEVRFIRNLYVSTFQKLSELHSLEGH